MKYIKILLSLFSLLACISACQEDILEKYPLDEVSSIDFLKTPSDMEIYMNYFYGEGIVFPERGAGWSATRRGVFAFEINSDNQIKDGYLDARLDGARSLTNIYQEWDYSLVRDINWFFDNYKKAGLDLELYQQYLGEAHFFRALIFFNLMQAFGDVLWIGTVPNVDSELLYATRNPRNEVANKIIADLDSAALYLTEERIADGTRVNKWFALAMKSRVALYEGTWEKYHAGTPFAPSSSDPNKYFQDAIEASREVMNSENFKLYSTGNSSVDYNDFFILPYADPEAVLFYQKFSQSLDVTHQINIYGVNPNGEGLTKSLVDSYLCQDGDPISVSPLYMGNANIADEFTNRDPRMYQSVWSPTAPWAIEEGNTTTWNEIWTKINSNSDFTSATGYANRKGFNPNLDMHFTSGEETPIVFLRYAEVLLNYAEALAELGNITQADIDKSIKLIRDRVGMPILNISSISTDPNWDFPTLSPIINEIRRERRIELVSEGNRWHDVARWAAADELISGKRPKGIRADQLANNPFPVDDNGFLDPMLPAVGSDGYGFVLGRDYLNPIPTEEIVLNPSLVQNPGW